MFRPALLALALTASVVSPALAQTRSVEDWSIEVETDDPYPTACRRPTSVQSGRTVTVTVPCRTYSGGTIPKRGVRVEAFADLLYRQTDELIDSCEMTRLVRKPGRFNLSCTMTLKAPFDGFPVEVSGAGNGTSETVALPGGKLIATIDVESVPDEYYSVYLHYENGDYDYLFDGDGPTLGAKVVVDVPERGRAFVEVRYLDGASPWSVTFTDAFPDS